MNKSFFLMSLLGLMLWWVGGACTKEEVSTSLTDEQLVPILADIHLMEAGIRELPLQTRDSLAPLYYELILDSYGITRSDFDSTMFVLREEPDRLIPVYNRVMEELSVREARSQ